MAGFQAHLGELTALGVSVIAASVDPLEEAKKVAAELSFPVAYGVTREQGDAIGCWWMTRRPSMQPSEFVLDANGLVMSSTYSSSPIGRVDAADVIQMIKTREARK